MHKVLIALLASIAVGILIAPAKDADTRKKLGDDFNNVADKGHVLPQICMIMLSGRFRKETQLYTLYPTKR
ncbi:MAG: YtxH domain-containing protein [Chitinophagaceae bacterium]